MSLRDDLVNQQKEQSQKNREKAKEEKALSLQREQNYKQQKAQLQKQTVLLGLYLDICKLRLNVKVLVPFFRVLPHQDGLPAQKSVQLGL